MLKDIKHKILVSEKLNFNLFLFRSWVNVRCSLFIDQDWRDFTFWLSSSYNEEFFNIIRSSYEVLYFILSDCLRIYSIFFWVVINQDRIGFRLFLHSVFVLLFVFIVFDHVENFCLSIVFRLVLGVFFKWHCKLLFIHTVSSRLHYFKNCLWYFEVLSLSISFVLLELFFHRILP